MQGSRHLRHLSTVVSQAATPKLPSVQDICDVCVVMSGPKERIRRSCTPTPGAPGLVLPESRSRLLGIVARRKIIRRFYKAQLSQADSRCQRLTVYQA